MYHPLKKHTLVAVGAALAVLLAGCGGSSSSPTIGPNANDGYFRFVNGSADSGTVDVYIDGTKINPGGIAYGTMTSYNKFQAGSHTIVVDATGTQTAVAGIPQAALSQSINAGQYVSLVLVGEQHPAVAADTVNVLAFTDQPYSTPSGGFAANFHNAAPVTGTGTTAFAVASGGGSQQLGSVAVGAATGPAGVSSNFISPTTTVTFSGTPSNTVVAAATLTPSMIDNQGCAANTLPCNSANLTLYFIDGPAASTTPSAGPYPDGITATQTATFAGIFDANGT